MRRLLLVASVLAFTACRGPKGDPGAPGLGGTSYVFSGAVDREPVTVSVPGLDIEKGSFVSVYVCKASNACDQLSGDPSATIRYEATVNTVKIIGAFSVYSTYSISAVIR